MPFDLPSFALSGTTVRAFNAVYRRHVPAEGAEGTMPYAKFLFPLDAIHEWNRIYGRRGFHQFQCLVPFEGGATALRQLLEGIAQSGRGSFLAVLKAMGERGGGYLSFPAPGYTLALDFPNAPGVSAAAGPARAHHRRPRRACLPGQGCDALPPSCCRRCIPIWIAIARYWTKSIRTAGWHPTWRGAWRIRKPGA